MYKINNTNEKTDEWAILHVQVFSWRVLGKEILVQDFLGQFVCLFIFNYCNLCYQISNNGYCYKQSIMLSWKFVW